MKKGDRFTKEFYMSDKIYQGFLDTFSDHNPLHTNLGFARKKGFDKIVMHGNILNGFLSFFIGECLPIKDVILLKQEINYRKPFFLKDLLSLHIRIEEYFESVNLIRFKFNFKNQNDFKVANGFVEIKVI